MGPFGKVDHPVLEPAAGSVVHCGVAGRPVAWEAMAVYNPAPVVRNGRIYMLYRADDWTRPLAEGSSIFTSRIGLAISEDGLHFARQGGPVVYPDNDPWREYEWEGGCQDLHVVEGEDGAYYMNYTTWTGRRDTMSVAVSSDLVHWAKHGPAFGKLAPDRVWGTRSGVVVTRLEGGRLVAARVNGKYLMYYTHQCFLAASDNLIDWQPLGTAVWPTYRQGFFDSGSAESGAIALQRDDGILLMYNGAWADGRWSLGQVSFPRTPSGRRTA